MSVIDPTAASGNATTAAASTTKTTDENSADRFLKLLVAQMQHQDPLNPLDNAEVTTQMAQISTVSGIEKMNKSIQTMSTSFAAMQTMQSVALVGRGAVVESDAVHLDANGQLKAGFEIEAPADKVRIDVLSAAGAVVDTIELGATDAGQHRFDWTPKNNTAAMSAASFRVTATSAGQALSGSTLVYDKVTAVRTGDAQLTLELEASGPVPYAKVKAFN